MIDRKVVFEEWKSLAIDVQFLGSIVQNPIENLSMEDRVSWEDSVYSFENKLHNLKAITKKLLEMS